MEYLLVFPVANNESRISVISSVLQMKMQTRGVTTLESTDELGRVCLAYAQQQQQQSQLIA